MDEPSVYDIQAIRLVLAAVVGPASSRLPRVAVKADISRRESPRGDQLCATAFS